ncbi:hypothetical protein ABVV53_16980 [Novosphingobium sp. RD2P27]|uniref:Uncharacterized protein n=1 Tax=Novosphingobium kalidii TaxID=3230299 RepID=A0ABV2D5Q5_9SPHN
MVDHRRDGSGSKKGIVIAILVVLILLVIAWAAGLFDVDTQGELTAPEISVDGGSLPNVNADVADIDVGTKTETVEVPTIDVNSAEADAE